MAFTDFEFDFDISKRYILFTVKETYKAIWEMLSPKEMSLPPIKNCGYQQQSNFIK
jgi:hypothetical protein